MPKVESVLKTEAVLTWEIPAWDGGANINNYVIEKRELPMESWVKCGGTRLTTAQIKGLSPGHKYEFRVYAENVYGRSNPSVPSSPCETPAPDIKKARRKVYELDETGKKIRGTKETVDNYDKFVFDIYSKYVAQAVDIKYESVYEYYDIHEEIGVGAFGVVHRCSEQKTGNIFAAKFIPVSSAIEKELIRKEIDIMNQLHHHKLINLHDAFEDDDEMVLIFEFLSGGELFERITAEGYIMSEAEVINYMRQICEGLKHMHEKNIIHLDVKPENIMCQTRNTTNVKLIDFGLATKIDPNEVVKISTGTAEFAAPEIVERDPVGFYTDMWAVGVLAYVLLSGLSPFAGTSDIDTLKNVKACDWDFDEDSFFSVSNEAKDFIRKLLTKNKEKRMTAHECLIHSWLVGETQKEDKLNTKRHEKYRDSIRMKYPNWDSYLVPMGKMSEYSSLRQLDVNKYKIHESVVDRRQAAPRFVIRPSSAFCYEGQSAKFSCRVIACAQATVSWFHNNCELRQSVKYMKRYGGDDYAFIINRVKTEDRGEYIIRAENHWGVREEFVFLDVKPLPPISPQYRPEVAPVRKRKALDYSAFQEEKDSAPFFTFHLRPRVIQLRGNVKLLACLTGKPSPEVKWYKDGRELNKNTFTQTFSDGVATLEVTNVSTADSGKYKCVANNSHGTDETSAVVIVEDGKLTEDQLESLKSRYKDRRYDPSKDTTYTTSSSSSRVEQSSSSSHKSETTHHTQSSSHKSSSQSSSQVVTDNTLSQSSKRLQKPYGGARSRSATKDLDVPDDSLMHPPVFKASLNDCTVIDGEPLSLKCTVDGDPDPKVEWHKDGTLLTSSDIIDLKYRNGVATLEINEVFPEDGGAYVCKAINSLGSAQTTCKLTIKPMSEGGKKSGSSGSKSGDKPPRISEHVESKVVEDGSQVYLQCKITGAKKFDVVWLHNDKEIKPSKDFQYETVGDVYKLSISEIFPEDSGTYTCEAFNDAGEAFSTCTLFVKVANEEAKGPTFKSFPRSITICEGQKAEFSLEMDKPPLKVTWFKDGKPVDENDSKYKFTLDGKKKFSLEMVNSSLNDIGMYSVKVTSKKGESTAAVACNIIAQDDL